MQALSPLFFAHSSPSNLYLSVEEESAINERQRLRDKSIKYVLDYIYYGVPCKVKGVISSNSPMEKSGKGGKKGSIMSDPDLTFITIDRNKVKKEKMEMNGVVDEQVSSNCPRFSIITKSKSKSKSLATFRLSQRGQRYVLFCFASPFYSAISSRNWINLPPGRRCHGRPRR